MNAIIQKPLEAIVRIIDPRNDFNRQCNVASDNKFIDAAVNFGKGALNGAKPLYRGGVLGAMGGGIYGIVTGEGVNPEYMKVGVGVGFIVDVSQIIIRGLPKVVSRIYNSYFNRQY